MRSYETTLNGVSIILDYEYEEGVPRDFDNPEEPPSVWIETVWVGKIFPLRPEAFDSKLVESWEESIVEARGG
jgi:hypothetical protein